MVTTPLSSPPPETRLWMTRRRTLLLAILVIATITIGTIIGSSWSIRDKEQEMEHSLQQRLTLLCAGQAQVIDTWLDGLIRQGDRIVNSDLFRLYASEVDLIEEDISYLFTPGNDAENGALTPLRQQLPELQNILLEFSHYAGFVSGRLVHPNGQAYLSTDSGVSALNDLQKDLTQQVLNTAQPRFSALQSTPAGLVLDMALPLFSLDTEDGSASVVAVLILTRVVTDKINQLLSASPLMEQGERSHLLQQTTSGPALITPWMPEQIASLKGQDLPLTDDGTLPFAVRPALQGGQKVYSVATPLKRLPWWIVEEVEYDAARHSLARHARTAWSISALLISIFSVGFGALWFQQVGLKNRETARHFKALAEQIDSQRQLLNSVNNNIHDFISLKDVRGLYQYINPAMVTALGREPEDILNRDDCAVFGFDTAKRLEKLDQQVVAGKQTVSVQETLYLQSHPTHLLISKVPLFEHNDHLSGIITVMSDITELVESQQRHERAIRRTVEALVSAIELNDSYLAGHSRRLRQFSVAVMKQLGGTEQQIAAVEMAANLSQIGKMFIDKELIAAQRPLTEEERRQIEEHVEHSARILRPIPFELPVPETIYQMNEHMDGSGYPQGLQGEAILLTARVLCAVNSFCAMVEPRAHRNGKSVEESLRELEGLQHQYDRAVVTALRSVVESPTGDKILQQQEDSLLKSD